MTTHREVQLDSGTLTIRDAQDPERHTVEADVLLQVLKGLQKTVRLLAAQEEGVHVSRVFKPGRDFRDHYTLLLGVPKPGSYDQPLSVVDRRPEVTEPLDESAAFYPLRSTLDLYESVARNDLNAAQMAVPNERIRRLALESVREAIPENRWSLELEAGGISALVDAQSRETVDRWLALPMPQDDVRLIAQVVGFDFPKKRVKLTYPPTGHILEAGYEVEVEEELFRERRDMVQVTGVALLDDEANPTELLEVTAISPIDLGPITISTVDCEDLHLVARAPIVLTPALSEGDSQFLVVVDPAIGLDAYARSRDELLPAIQEDLAFVWECYALENPERLTSDAQMLRERLLAAFEVAE
ncbi:MAG: hypothetical protein U1E29_17635 [Coriobacteriia bacterium]|nr:hypothetical protein [Coriobacteriia bacterium]